MSLIAVKLDALATEAEGLQEERVVAICKRAAKSARWSDKLRAARLKRVGGIVAGMKAKGLSDSEIVARLTAGT